MSDTSHRSSGRDSLIFVAGIVTLTTGLLWLMPFIGWRAQLGKALLALSGMLFVLLPFKFEGNCSPDQQRARNWLAYIAAALVMGFGMTLTSTNLHAAVSIRHLFGCLCLIIGSELIVSFGIRREKSAKGE